MLSNQLLYVQVQNYILEKIRSNELKPDDKIPTEKELSEMFNVSRITSSTAINRLAQEGYLYRQRGKGTFVLGNRKKQTFNSNVEYSFETNKHTTTEDSSHKTYDIRAIEASDEIKKHLELNSDEKVNQIIRIKYVETQPVSCEYIYIPISIVGVIDQNSLGDDVNIDQYLFDEKDINIYSNKVYIDTIKSGIFESDYLNIDIGIQLLLIEHILYDKHNKPITYARLVFNNEDYRVSLAFDKYKELTIS